MKNVHIYIRIFMAILFLGMMPSCTYDTIHVGGLNEHANVTLALALGDQSVQVSRAEDAENTENPENTISSVDLFFYKAGDGVNALPIHVEEGITSISTDGEISFTMPVEKFEALFANDATECQVFAIVNRPAASGTDNVLPSDKSVAGLKSMVLKANFASTQTSFVMVSSNRDDEGKEIVGDNGMVTIDRTEDGKLSGTIPVKRVAAKIGFELVYPEDETQLTVKDDNDNILWVADPDDVEISFRTGSLRTYLGSAFTKYTDTDLFNVEYVDYEDNLSFYTYPTNWDADEAAHTHLMVKVTWTKADNTETKTTYYEISNINPGFEYIEQNHYYLIQQSISVLGGDSEEEAITLENACYNVLDWGNAGLSGVLNRNRYLAVDETNVVMNNIFTKRIYFATSDPIDLVNAEVLWHYAGQENARDLSMVSYTNSSIANIDEKTYTLSSTTAVDGVANRINGDYVVTIKIHHADTSDPSNYIEISHALKDGMDKSSDFTKYMINLTVQHHDDSKFKETIKITQYPMMYIEAKLNSDFGKDGDENNNTANGYVYINNDNGKSWAGKRELDVNSTQYNHNPNRYLISISSLANTSVEQQYIIGDPRSTTSAPPTDIYSGTNNTLTTYYPTNADGTEKMVSPQFMVASSYGLCRNSIDNIDDAKRRCATYQEDGYPAGRWRVPTKSEIQYIIQLSGWELIPALFNTGIGYWSAQGCVTVDGNGNVTDFTGGSSWYSTRVVRCVYDTWHWGTEAPLTGDAKMQFTYMN